ncbi:MAG TPA: Ig-like domain-containing protein, partial [Candidatus Kapabacteria bacterium]|nr:Ig-like domain-containing protein [Candidatus Kapabacteria bacterium]
SIGSEYHTSFRLGTSGGIALARMQNGEAAVIDYLQFGTASANVSFGASPNGQVDDRITMSPTPAAANVGTQPNLAPAIQAIAAKSVAEGSLLQFTVVATDPDAGQALSYAMQGAPVGASLTAAGVFTWTPTEAQAPSATTVTVIVSDNGSPTLSATNTFQLTATEVNANPTLPSIADRSVTEGSLMSISLNATDSDFPAQSLSYALSNAPAGMIVSSAGVVTWTPVEAQGPNSYAVGVTASDNGTPAGSATATFIVTVLEANTAPIISAIGDQTVSPGTLVSFNASATDTDLPLQTLSFALEPGAPSGASITPTGAFSWMPSTNQAGTTNTITVRVTDSHSPAASATRSFVVIVRASANALTVTANLSAQGGCVLNWNTQAGVRYRIVYQNALQIGGSWQTLGEVDGTGTAVNYSDATATGVNARFYRIAILP